MSKNKNAVSVSFRVPADVMKKLKKHVQYTKWIQNLVMKHLGYCSTCGQRIVKETVVPNMDDV